MSISDNLLGTLPFYIVFRLFHLSRETAYQCWFLLLLSLNYWFCFGALRKLKLNHTASAMGAFMFAFSLPVAGGLSHLQMYPRFIFPVIMVYLYLWLRDGKRSLLYISLYCLVYQLYCGIYLGLMSVLAIWALCIAWIITQGYASFFTRIKELFVTRWLITVINILICMLMVVLLLYPYIQRSDEVQRGYAYVVDGLPTFLSYMYPARGTWLYGGLYFLGKHIPNPHEHTLFTGITGICVFIAGWWFSRKSKQPMLRFWMWTGSVLFFFTLHIFHDVSFYRILCFIPGFEVLRAGSRIIHIQLFFIAVALAILVHRFMEHTRVQKLIPVVYLLFMVIVADQWVYTSGFKKFSKQDSVERLTYLRDKVNSSSAHHYSAFVYLPDSFEHVYRYHVDAMIVAQQLQFPTVNGYSAYSPRYYQPFFEKPDREHYIELTRNIGLDTGQVLVITSP